MGPRVDQARLSVDAEVVPVDALAGLVSRSRVQGWFRVQGPGFRVQGSGFRVEGSGFRIQGSGLRVGFGGCLPLDDVRRELHRQPAVRVIHSGLSSDID